MTDSLPGSMRVTAAICLMRGGMILSFIAKVYVNTYTTQQKNKEFLRIPDWRKKSVMHPPRPQLKRNHPQSRAIRVKALCIGEILMIGQHPKGGARPSGRDTT